jgi:hypothetical protein
MRRLAGDALPPLLILPCGFAGVIVVGTAATSIASLAPATGWLIVGVAGAGFVSAWPLLRLRRSAWEHAPWSAAAATGTFAVFAAPVVLTGQPTFTGFLRIVDIAHNFDFTNQLVHEGRSFDGTIDSSYTQVVANLVGSGYPGGFQGVLGGLARLVDTDLAWVYQPLLAVGAAMGAIALYALLDGIIRNRPLRALAAFVAAQPNLLYGYGLVGGFKELITAGLLVTAVALLRSQRFDVSSWRSALPVSVVLAAGFAVISYTVLPWLGLILGGVFVLGLARGPSWRPFVAQWAWLAGLTALLCLPMLEAARKATSAVGVAEAPKDLGNLAAPLEPWTSVGVWLTGDYRYPLAQRVDLTYVLVGLVLVLAVIGVAHAVRTRQTTPILVALAFGGALVYVTRRTGPWVDAKAFAITGMACLALAFAGIAALNRGPQKFIAWPVAAIVAGAVLYGNALAYHDITLAPRDRLRDLERIGHQLEARGPTLYPAFGEYAEYFLRRQRATSLVNPPLGQLGVRQDIPANSSAFVRDLDDFTPSFLQSFRYIVERRSPVSSRPPSNFRMAQRTRFHTVWEKDSRRPEVLRHYGFYAGADDRRAETCRPISRAVRVAGPGAGVAYRLAPHTTVFEPTGALPRGWAPGWIPQGPGRIQGRIRLPRDGRYRVWLGGSIGRPVDVSFNGRLAGSVSYQEDYPGQFEHLADLWMARGVHRAEIARHGGSLHPGSGDGGPQSIGPLIIEKMSTSDDRVRYTTADRAVALCRGSRPLDWLEIIASRR